MNLLLNSQRVVVSASNYDYVRTPEGVHAIEGDSIRISFQSFLENNSTIVENLLDANVPAQVEGKYFYTEGGQFIRNPQFKEPTEDSMFGVFQMLDSHIPKSGDIETRVEKLIKFILELAERADKLFDISPELVEGLKLRNENINSLTGSALVNYKRGQNYINKMRTRLLIEREVGDIYDQVADIEKQMLLTYTMNIRAFKLILDLYQQLTLTIPQDVLPAATKTAYQSLSDMFLSLVSSGQYIDRIDIEDANTIANTLIARKISIPALVKPNYLDKYFLL